MKILGETKAGYIAGPTREELIGWVIASWREISSDIISKAFEKAKILGDFTAIPNVFQEANTICEKDIDLNDHYLDEFEQSFFYNSEIIEKEI